MTWIGKASLFTFLSVTVHGGVACRTSGGGGALRERADNLSSS